MNVVFYKFFYIQRYHDIVPKTKTLDSYRENTSMIYIGENEIKFFEDRRIEECNGGVIVTLNQCRRH